MDQHYNAADKDTSSSLFDTGLAVDATGREYLRTTVTWTKFLAVMGFIFIALLAVAGMYMMFAENGYSRYGSGYVVVQGLVVMIAVILYIYPTVQLNKFSITTKAALNTGDQLQWNAALRHQRNMFKYLGILMIVVLSIYALIFLVAILGSGRY